MQSKSQNSWWKASIYHMYVCMGSILCIILPCATTSVMRFIVQCIYPKTSTPTEVPFLDPSRTIAGLLRNTAKFFFSEKTSFMNPQVDSYVLKSTRL